MRVAAAIFVKTPGLSPVKTRLAQEIGERAALEFYALSTECTAEVVERSRCEPYWAVAELEAFRTGMWSREGFGSIRQGDGDLGERLDRVYGALLDRTEGVLLLGADCPALSVEDLDRAAAKLEEGSSFVLGPATDGGFYLFGGRRPVPREAWLKTPYSVAETSIRLEDNLSGVAPVVRLSGRSDVDELSDLRRLHEELAGTAGLVPAQKRLFSWLESHFSS